MILDDIAEIKENRQKEYHRIIQHIIVNNSDLVN